MPSGMTDFFPRTQPSQGSLEPTQATVQSGKGAGSGRAEDGRSLTGPSDANSSSSSSSCEAIAHERAQDSVIDAAVLQTGALQNMDAEGSESKSPVVSVLTSWSEAQ
eukprot:7875818-Alexandrium_andersonii.AAC.1